MPGARIIREQGPRSKLRQVLRQPFVAKQFPERAERAWERPITDSLDVQGGCPAFSANAP